MYDMYVSCLFEIIKDNDNTIKSHLFHLSYMAVNIIHELKTKVGKVLKGYVSESRAIP